MFVAHNIVVSSLRILAQVTGIVVALAALGSVVVSQNRLARVAPLTGTFGTCTWHVWHTPGTFGTPSGTFGTLLRITIKNEALGTSLRRNISNAAALRSAPPLRYGPATQVPAAAKVFSGEGHLQAIIHVQSSSGEITKSPCGELTSYGETPSADYETVGDGAKRVRVLAPTPYPRPRSPPTSLLLPPPPRLGASGGRHEAADARVEILLHAQCHEAVPTR